MSEGEGAGGGEDADGEDSAGRGAGAGEGPGDATATDDDRREPALDVDLDPAAARQTIQRVREEVAKRIVGQEEVVTQLLTCLLADGNALLESNPGLGKTLLVRTLAGVTDLSFSRIQNTPDLMPSDVTGTEIIREVDDHREFVFEKGPVFANVVLADEINRATPKTQSALLEAMQEQQVTVFGRTYDLPEPFFLLATQNPIDLEGTYPLPEAQADRFLLKILLEYPSFEEEVGIVERYTHRVDQRIPVDQVLDPETLLAMQQLVRDVPIADDLRDEAIRIVRRTRDAEAIEFGASPRASLGLVVVAKARAFVEGRAYVSEADLHAMAPPVLRHRVVLDFRAEREGVTPDDAVRELL